MNTSEWGVLEQKDISNEVGAMDLLCKSNLTPVHSLEAFFILIKPNFLFIVCFIVNVSGYTKNSDMAIIYKIY